MEVHPRLKNKGDGGFAITATEHSAWENISSLNLYIKYLMYVALAAEAWCVISYINIVS